MLSSSNSFRRYWSIPKICVEITVMLAHQPNEGPNPVKCSSCSCAQLTCRCKYTWSFLHGGFGTRLSRGEALCLDVYCLFKISLVCKGWLYWPPNWCLWLQHHCRSAVPSLGDLNFCHLLQKGSVCFFLFQHFFVEVFVSLRVLWNPSVVLAVLADDTSPWLSAAFCVPQVGHLGIKPTRLTGGCIC